MSYDEIPCPQCRSNLYFPGSTCSDCGYNDQEGVTAEGFRRVEDQLQRQQASSCFQPLFARAGPQRRTSTSPIPSYDKEWLNRFDAAFGSRRPQDQEVVSKRFQFADTAQIETRFSSHGPVAPKPKFCEDDLRKFGDPYRERVATDKPRLGRRARHLKESQRSAPVCDISGATRPQTKLSRAEYVTVNTHRLVSEAIDEVSLAVIQGFLYDHYDANRSGALSRCVKIRKELAQFLNTLQAVKLQQLESWDSKLLARFLKEKV